jgi:hypothetical protein
MKHFLVGVPVVASSCGMGAFTAHEWFLISLGKGRVGVKVLREAKKRQTTKNTNDTKECRNSFVSFVFFVVWRSISPASPRVGDSHSLAAPASHRKPNSYISAVSP